MKMFITALLLAVSYAQTETLAKFERRLLKGLVERSERRRLEGLVTISGTGCVIDGDCVTSDNFPNTYSDNANCKVTINYDSTSIAVEEWDLETCCDFVEVDGKGKDAGSMPSMMNAGESFDWKSDVSNDSAFKGWKMCFSIPYTTVALTTTDEVCTQMSWCQPALCPYLCEQHDVCPCDCPSMEPSAAPSMAPSHFGPESNTPTVSPTICDEPEEAFCDSIRVTMEDGSYVDCPDICFEDVNPCPCKCPHGVGPSLRRCDFINAYDPCLNDGVCVSNPDTGMGMCMCANHYDGERCEIDLNHPCQQGICNEMGTEQCVENGASYTCMCKDDYQGTDCSEPKGVDLCANKNCDNGECSVVDGEAKCICNVGYVGELCEIEQVDKTLKCGENPETWNWDYNTPNKVVKCPTEPCDVTGWGCPAEAGYLQSDSSTCGAASQLGIPGGTPFEITFSEYYGTYDGCTINGITSSPYFYQWANAYQFVGYEHIKADDTVSKSALSFSAVGQFLMNDGIVMDAFALIGLASLAYLGVRQCRRKGDTYKQVEGPNEEI